MIQFTAALDELNDIVTKIVLPGYSEDEKRQHWKEYRKQYNELRLALRIYETEIGKRSARRRKK